MWLVGLVVVQAWFALSSAWHEYFYPTLFLTLIYVLWYRDGKEYTGERRWDGFRRCVVWKHLSPASFTFASQTYVTDADRKLFVMMPCITPAPMWWFSVHGGRLQQDLNLCYVMPPLFFAIPVLRDVMMWSGAVTYQDAPWKAENREQENHRRRNGAILNLLNANRSVCYAPSGFSDVLHNFNDDDPEEGVQTNFPDDALFEFARENRVQIIPVIVAGEKKRYRVIAGARWIRWIQARTHAFLGYPLPLLFWARTFAKRSLEIQIGPVIHCARSADVESLKQIFRETVENIKALPEDVNEFHTL